MSEILFVGFGTAEAWLECKPIGLRVNVDTITENHSGQHGLGRATTALVLSYHETGSDEASYLYVPIDAWQTFNGAPFVPDEKAELEKHQKRGESALEAALSWLRLMGIPYRRAVAAFPANLSRLEGRASWLRYDKEAGTFRFEPVPETEEA